MRDNMIPLYLTPEDFAQLSEQPRYKRCEMIREALRQAKLIGRSSQQTESPSIAV